MRNKAARYGTEQLRDSVDKGEKDQGGRVENEARDDGLEKDEEKEQVTPDWDSPAEGIEAGKEAGKEDGREQEGGDQGRWRTW